MMLEKPTYPHLTSLLPTQATNQPLSFTGLKVFFRKLAYGAHPAEVAEEVMRTVRRKKQEVFMANPVPKAAVYIRTFFPEFFFAVVACGVKDKLNVPEEG
jgi:dehydrogenase/reductase SDR family protein 7C